jgi:hypothetical protein
MANPYEVMVERLRLPVDELCKRFADSPGMFIRGVTPEDARKLWDFGISSGYGGFAVLGMAESWGTTPDETIAVLLGTLPDHSTA